MIVPQQPPPPTVLHCVQRFVLNGVSWADYDRILEGLGTRNLLRVTYDRGTLELMSPYPIHEVYKTFFGRLLDVLFADLDIPGRAVGSTTFRRQSVERGLEPDQSFYLASAARVSNWRVLDLRVEPPPDLAIEVEISRSILDRIGIYAALGIPEIWVCNEERVRVLALRADATYEERPDSVLLPFMPMDELFPFIEQSVDLVTDGPFLRALRTWVRTHILPRYQTWKATQPGT